MNLCDKEYRMTLPRRNELISEVLSPSMTAACFNRCYKNVRKKVIGSNESHGVCRKKKTGNRDSLVGFVQISSDKLVMTLEKIALVADPVHAMLSSASLKKWQWMVCNGPTLVGFLPVNCRMWELQNEESGEKKETFGLQIYIFHERAAEKRCACYREFRAEKNGWQSFAKLWK